MHLTYFKCLFKDKIMILKYVPFWTKLKKPYNA